MATSEMLVVRMSCLTYWFWQPKFTHIKKSCIQHKYRDGVNKGYLIAEGNKRDQVILTFLAIHLIHVIVSVLNIATRDKCK